VWPVCLTHNDYQAYLDIVLGVFINSWLVCLTHDYQAYLDIVLGVFINSWLVCLTHDYQAYLDIVLGMFINLWCGPSDSLTTTTRRISKLSSGCSSTPGSSVSLTGVPGVFRHCPRGVHQPWKQVLGLLSITKPAIPPHPNKFQRPFDKPQARFHPKVTRIEPPTYSTSPLHTRK